ncbi:MAG: hypothetical protein OEY36_10745 [Gammaproteobacteria bacterium]|nr:hypothetical protein [Gammaproteobacteria bacterium]
MSFAEQNNQLKPSSSNAEKMYGKVTETMDAAGYTYVRIENGELNVWAAAPKTTVNIGDMIAITTEMPMNNHYSKSLNRDFKVVYFVARFITDKVTENSDDPAHLLPHAKIKNNQYKPPAEGIEKVEGGYTISDIYINKKSLEGKSVLVRGQVTKFTAKVMGKNWIHIRDSSTHQDLTATTDETAQLDEVVTLKGTLALDKDFNYGYVYPLIVENSKLTK